MPRTPSPLRHRQALLQGFSETVSATDGLTDPLAKRQQVYPARPRRSWPDAVQQEFVETHFEAIFPPGWSPSAGERMRNLREEALPALGVLPASIAAIEELYVGLLRRLEAHFADHPYLLGGRPCIGDFGMINAWLAEQEDLAPGTIAERRVGEDAVFDFVGTEIGVAAQPFRFYVLKRMQDEFEALQEPERGAAAALLAACGMAELLDLKLTRDIGRRNNLEVWL